VEWLRWKPEVSTVSPSVRLGSILVEPGVDPQPTAVRLAVAGRSPRAVLDILAGEEDRGGPRLSDREHGVHGCVPYSETLFCTEQRHWMPFRFPIDQPKELSSVAVDVDEALVVDPEVVDDLVENDVAYLGPKPLTLGATGLSSSGCMRSHLRAREARSGALRSSPRLLSSPRRW